MKRKTLLLTVGLIAVLCYGCGNQTTTEAPTAEESASTDEAVAQEEAESTEQEEESQEVEEEAEPEPETETVYLLSKETYYDENDEILYQYIYEYNEETGDKLKCTTKNKDNDDVVSTFEYYDNGNLKKETSLHEDGSENYYKEYNEDGTEAFTKLNSREFDDNISETEYTYENGLLVSSINTIYNSDGTLVSIVNSKYNEFGDIESEKSTIYFEGGSLEGEWEDIENEYDSNNRLIKVTQFVVDSYTTQEYEYDQNNNIIVDLFKICDSDGTVNYYIKHTYMFDSYGNIIMDAGYNENDEMESCYNTENTYSNDMNKLTSYVTTDMDGNITSRYEAEYIALELQKQE